MNKNLLRVSLRQRALYLPDVPPVAEARPAVLGLCAELRRLGYTVSEPLLHALNGLTAEEQRELTDVMNDVMGTQLNWAALVRGWLTPTGESVADHFATLLANLLKKEVDMSGTTLACGHLIPDGSFDLRRYTGCPFCGRPLLTAEGQAFSAQGTKLKELQRWGDAELDRHFADLLASPVPLDATQRESLTTLLRERPLPQTDIAMKETRMLVADSLVEQHRDEEAGRLFSSPQDIMRYLWFRHTGHTQLLEPHTLLNAYAKNQRHEHLTPEELATRVDGQRQALRLRYGRDWCRRVALWLNALPLPADRYLEAMHPKRRLWVRFIRALRLTEYARKPGFGPLREMLDRFYRQDYPVWAAQVAQTTDTTARLELLRERPGLFARCLFSTMLRFQPTQVLEAFGQVAPQLPPRLLLTLGSQAQLYFDRTQQRVARPLSGVMKTLPPHPLLECYSDDDLRRMQQAVNDLYLDVMRKRFATAVDDRQPKATIYIDPRLYDIPVSVGDRAATVQDTSAALQGTRFAVEGDAVRLFLQWGRDLPAQPLDMDLSCHLLKDDGTVQLCSYFSLSVPGAKHSGDIRQIPDRVGTAEYIELSLDELYQTGVQQAVFTCNAYTSGQLQPNLVVGWMDARHPMRVSEETGVAYDPSTVTHSVRITETNLAKGLIFGVLDVERREITWLEMPFDGQTVLSVNTDTVNAYLRRLRAKPTVGQLLRLKAEAQSLTLTTDMEQATEVYTCLWAQDAAAVSGLLLG